MAGLRRILPTMALVIMPQLDGYTHEVGARGSHVLGWHSDQISRVVSFTPYGMAGDVVNIDGRQCLQGYQFYFDVLDNFAFDVDESVELAIEIDLGASARKIRLDYDRNGGPSAPAIIDLPAPAGDRSHVARVRLERARFAGRGDFRTDFRISAQSEVDGGPRADRPDTTICSIEISRSHASNHSDDFGWLDLTIQDERGDTTPARVALFDDSGRMPLPARSALEIKDFADRTRSMLLPVGTVNWPSRNRYAFYSDGRYRARLRTGDYNLIVTKGIEYRFAERRFHVADGKTLDVTVELERWIDMPSQGWISGDIHVHIPRRDDAENHSLWLQGQAEDIHVVNSLEMGNITATHFRQSAWGPDGRFGKNMSVVVAGQEDPRSAVRGHTIHLNLRRPVRFPDRYLLYHDVFEAVAEQDGISGYAHLNRLGARIGMALDAPSGLVKFIEVLQRGRLGTDVWFEFLNLGYRIAPAAGSDVPYGARIGDVRSYAKMKDVQFPDGWFTALAEAHTFVTNGPILIFELNGFEMGDVVSLSSGEPIVIQATAIMNPDIDLLDRLELIEQGEVIVEVSSETGSEILELSHELSAEHGTWFVLRAYGKNQTNGDGSVAAASAPIYVSVDGQRTWRPDRVVSLARKMQSELDGLSSLTLESAGRLDEWFETRDPWTAQWSSQQELLEERLQQAKAHYDELIELSAAQ